MASENELQIVLTLVDNASKELKKITGEVKKDTEDIAKGSEKATKSIKDGFKDAGKELKDFRKVAFILAAEIGFIVAAVKEWGNHNQETKNALNGLGTAGKNIFAMFGSIFAPAIISLNDVVQKSMGFLGSLFDVIQRGYTWLFKTISYGTQYIVAFTSSLMAGSSAAQAHADALSIAGRAAEEMGEKFSASFKENIPQVTEMTTKVKEMNSAFDAVNLQYLTGAITAQQYYDIISSNSAANYQAMQMQMSLMQQLSQQENLMNNDTLLNYKTNIDARIGLLKTLQSYHHTAYSTMMDFANMTIQKVSTGMTTALTGIIMGTKKAREAWTEFGKSMITSIVEFVVQYTIQMLLAAALSKVIMASTIGQAAAISAAWLPAAIYASIATMGAADAAGIAGLSTATASGLAIGTAAMATSKAAGNSMGMDIGMAMANGKAEGGWVGLNGPEIALVGERGPEYVVPNNRLSGMSGVNVYNYIYNPVMRSDEDINRLAEEISSKLARESERA